MPQWTADNLKYELIMAGFLSGTLHIHHQQRTTDHHRAAFLHICYEKRPLGRHHESKKEVNHYIETCSSRFSVLF